jgi:hypothetical protein
MSSNNKTKKNKAINKDKLITSLSFDTELKYALEIINYYILNPKHSSKYEHLTYVDEVVILCLLKDVVVTFNDEDANYYIEGQIVTDSINKLIEKGYIHYDTLKPNKSVLRRLYVNHPFNVKEIKEDTIKNLLYYDIVKNTLTSRNRWSSKSFVNTINDTFVPTNLFNCKPMSKDSKHRVKTKIPLDERVSFCTLVNFINLIPRSVILDIEEDVYDVIPEVNTRNTKKHKKLSTRVLECERFDFNVSRLEMITSVLLNKITGLLQE